jgi:hypothetical protein
MSMNATELATVVEGWATLVGLMVVIAGAVFAEIQLRQEAKARKLQALMSVLTDIRPAEVAKAWLIVRSLPDGFDGSTLNIEERTAILLVAGSYGRIGTLLAVGAVDEADIFPHLTFSRGAIEAYEKIKHMALGENSYLPSMIMNEQMASRAQSWLLRHGAKRFGSMPRFEANWDALNALGAQVAEARATAH